MLKNILTVSFSSSIAILDLYFKVETLGPVCLGWGCSLTKKHLCSTEHCTQKSGRTLRSGDIQTQDGWVRGTNDTSVQ